MSKQVYISADYDYYNGDQDVVEELVKWGKDDKHKVDFVDMSNPSSGSISDSNCDRNNKEWYECYCTPYKQNINGKKLCKWTSTSPESDGNVGNINAYSYLRHEFEQAKIKGKPIIIVYNSIRYESSWLPSYMKDYEDNAVPFWIKDIYGNKVGNYSYIKEVLGF